MTLKTLPANYSFTTEETPPGVAVLRIRGRKEAEAHFEANYPWLARQITADAAVKLAREICFASLDTNPLQAQPPVDTGQRLHSEGQGQGKAGLSDLQEGPLDQQLPPANTGSKSAGLGEPGSNARLDTADNGGLADYTC
jgi:hypothetical protein